MKDDLLLDTQAFLWFWWDDPQLSMTAKTTICDPSKRKLISTASAWEVAIKVSLKKLDLGAPYRGFIHQHMVRNNFLPVDARTRRPRTGPDSGGHPRLAAGELTTKHSKDTKEKEENHD